MKAGNSIATRLENVHFLASINMIGNEGLVAMYVTGAARGQEMEDNSIGHKEEEGGVKRSSGGGGDFNRCFSLPIDPGGGVRSLKHMDSKKLKEEIKKWAKKVVAYARQVSDHFGSSRR